MLDHLLEDGRLEIEGITGASAGLGAEFARQLAAVAEGQLEHGHEQQRRDNRRKHRLHPNLQKPAHLPLVKGPQAEAVERAVLAQGAGLIGRGNRLHGYCT